MQGGYCLPEDRGFKDRLSASTEESGDVDLVEDKQVQGPVSSNHRLLREWHVSRRDARKRAITEVDEVQ